MQSNQAWVSLYSLGSMSYPLLCRSVSYVPAAYYAHLAAFRGRLMQKDDDTTSMSSGSSGDRAVTLLDIDNEYAKKMFYA